MTMTTVNQKKARLRLVLAVAASLGCSSAMLSGVLSTLAYQQPTSGQVRFA